MKQLHVFYRIFHDDLSPSNELTTQRLQEYEKYLLDSSAFNNIPKTVHSNTKFEMALQFRYYEVLVQNNISSFKEWLYRQVFVVIEDESQIKKLIKKCQIYIQVHLDKIKNSFLSHEEYHHVYVLSESKNVVDVYKIICQNLIDLQGYIENTFKHYIDDHIIVPYNQQKYFIDTQKEKVISILMSMEEFKMDQFLKTQISEVLNKFLDDGFSDLTHAQIKYSEIVLSVLHQFFWKVDTKTEDDLIELLVQYNFNRSGVFRHLIRKIQALVNRFTSKSEKLSALHHQLKFYNRIQIQEHYSYNRKLKPLHLRCIEWLEQEIETFTLLESSIPAIKNSEESVAKINTNFSVGDIALILKLLQENDSIKISKSSMFRTASKHLKSKNSASISSKSLSNSYYDITESNKKSVQRILNKMLTTLDDI